MGCPKYGLNINPSKTQILMNKYVTRSDINILNTRVEISQNVKYLGRTFADDGSLTAEVARRIRAGWAAFNAIRREVLQSPQKIRNRLLTTTVIPAMTYGCRFVIRNCSHGHNTRGVPVDTISFAHQDFQLQQNFYSPITWLLIVHQRVATKLLSSNAYTVIIFSVLIIFW
uniref:Reverse transcriptase domain-containing protein n=1 Tax=Caenorhabditis japonica TaxID=281687 RepID=A0A8R1ICG8_CAEJA